MARTLARSSLAAARLSTSAARGLGTHDRFSSCHAPRQISTSPAVKRQRPASTTPVMKTRTESPVPSRNTCLPARSIGTHDPLSIRARATRRCGGPSGDGASGKPLRGSGRRTGYACTRTDLSRRRGTVLPRRLRQGQVLSSERRSRARIRISSARNGRCRIDPRAGLEVEVHSGGFAGRPVTQNHGGPGDLGLAPTSP